MKLRSIIIDDEETGAETLRFLIEKHISDVKVVAQTIYPQEAIELIEDYKPEIVFLDISMPEMDGFELLERLAWRKFNLIFTTAHQEHALKAIKQNAVDYLLKPIDYKDLRAAVDRIKKQMLLQKEYEENVNYITSDSLSQHHLNKLAVTSKHTIEALDVSKIISLESKSNYTQIYLDDSKILLTPKTLGEFDSQLCSTVNFMRVHHSFVINLQKILRYLKDGDTIVMVNNQKIPLSRSRRENFFKWMNE